MVFFLFCFLPACSTAASVFPVQTSAARKRLSLPFNAKVAAFQKFQFWENLDGQVSFSRINKSIQSFQSSEFHYLLGRGNQLLNPLFDFLTHLKSFTWLWNGSESMSEVFKWLTILKPIAGITNIEFQSLKTRRGLRNAKPTHCHLASLIKEQLAKLHKTIAS